ncbi:hypothetical protein P167DRAFT_563887 [Morchella conica CCBAS932]|uniref:DUF3752 domain-containing protein n=1 Tax=Morchella conica CCBAS932 TaxID=1392247 RepID=A0A3N4KV27_9PEZI|nr:hypothetical protein P167DRAFT_563887 [Morchella conica CCBAS932]
MEGDLVGPVIPPHILAKRKRKAEEAAAAAAAASKSPPTEDPDSKKRRTVGPAPPPAPLNERSSGYPDDDDNNDSSSDDDIGPALPPGAGTEVDQELAAQRRLAMFAEAQATKADDSKPKRDEWMLVPPKSEDWASKVDPTKLKNRKFQSGKGAKAPQKAGRDNSLWTESPEERRKRLNDEVMGIRKPATQGDNTKKPSISAAEAEETARRIKEYNEKNRNRSLYDQHKSSGSIREKEDNPSARAFDREKDIAGGRKVGHQQKKEMLQRAAQFGDRFSSGNFL